MSLSVKLSCYSIISHCNPKQPHFTDEETQAGDLAQGLTVGQWRVQDEKTRQSNSRTQALNLYQPIPGRTLARRFQDKLQRVKGLSVAGKDT